MLFFSIINLILSFYAFLLEYRKNSIVILFWGCSIFFVGLPLLIDVVSLKLDKDNELELYLQLQDINHVYDFNNTDMLYMSSFIFLVNLFLFIGTKLVNNSKKEFKIPNNHQFEYMMVIFNYISLIVLLLNFKGQWFATNFEKESNIFYQISSLLICLFTSASLTLALSGKKKIALVNLFPTIFISFVLSERPYLAPAIGVIFIYFASMGKKISNLINLLLIGLVSIFLMRFVRYVANGDKGFNLFDILFSRDSATSVLYYIFQNTEYYYSLTTGKATIFLISTGLVPSFLLGVRDFSIVDIPSMLAFDRFGWTFGTIHPTMYGWLFVDLGWLSLLFAFFLGLILSSLNSLFATLSLRLFSIYLASITIFIFVGMRGSLQVGYSKSIYILIFGLIFYYFYKFLVIKYPRLNRG
ncbi:hypothetical protein [Acinetobacter sp. YH12108]|uniref:hypothetical protein n=1 Tax=Acinetobacter sp. YH12108 TaxID=2601095 RepID=UPI0015D41B77|nr:hypothetical protein [Acinetobacter sp. YH12108]